jgi:hypothetical protein
MSEPLITVAKTVTMKPATLALIIGAVFIVGVVLGAIVF